MSRVGFPPMRALSFQPGPASYPPGNRKFGTFRHLGETGAMIDELITDLKNAR